MTRIFVSPWLRLVALVAFAFVFSATNFAQTESVIHQFIPYSAGAGPSGLAADGKGNFYGTAGGGLYNGGVVFKLTPGSNGSYQSTVLHSFGGTKTDGNSPWGGSYSIRREICTGRHFTEAELEMETGSSSS